LAVQARRRNGAVAGLLATLAMSAATAISDLETLRFAVAGLYASEGSLLVGWAAHLLDGTLFGVLFAAVLTDATLEDLTASPPNSAGAGAVYGLAPAVVGAGIIMPSWLTVVEFGASPSVPHVTLQLPAWRVVYGVVLGGACAHRNNSPPGT